MAKKVTGYIKLQIPAGKATPAPPVGPALGQHGVNIVEFTKQFNARTADQGDLVIPVVITVYAGSRSVKEGLQDPVRFRRAEPHQGCDHQARRSPQDRRAEDARPERCEHRDRYQHDRRYRQKHGHRGRGLRRTEDEER